MLFLKNRAHGEGTAEDKTGNRTGNQQVPGQSHYKVARDVDEPHHRQHLQVGKRTAGHVEQALAGAVERHDDDHGNDHAGANGERHGERRALARRDQVHKGKTLGERTGDEPVTAHGKDIGNGEAEPRSGNDLAADGPVLQGNVVDAHPEHHAKAHDKGEQQALSFVDRHEGQVPFCVASRRRQQKRTGEMELLGLHLARPCYERLRLLMW